MKKASEHGWELLMEDGMMTLTCTDSCADEEQAGCYCGDPETLQEMLSGVIQIDIKVWSDRIVTPDGADYDAGAAITGATVPAGEGTQHGEGQESDVGG